MELVSDSLDDMAGLKTHEARKGPVGLFRHLPISARTMEEKIDYSLRGWPSCLAPDDEGQCCHSTKLL